MNGTVTAVKTVEEAHEEAALEAKDQQLDTRWSHRAVELGTDYGEYRIVRPKIRQLLNSGLILLVVFFPLVVPLEERCWQMRFIVQLRFTEISLVY